MPNTLAHIAVNSISTKIIIPKSELLWIYIGCIIPDFPWIIRKVVSFLLPSINGYDLQAYAIIQSSLIFSIILSLAFALISQSKSRTFIILALGSLIHLLFDLIQIKWANGVILLAPFSWQLSNYGFFWPENIINYIITCFGFLYFILNWKKVEYKNLPIVLRRNFSILSLSLILVYFLTPFLFLQNIYSADNHFVSTLKEIDDREGNYIELDRKPLLHDKLTESYWIQSFNKDLIELSEINGIKSSRISVKGYFETNNRIKVIEFHENWDLFRDGASYIGLFLILLSWVTAVIRNNSNLLYQRKLDELT